MKRNIQKKRARRTVVLIVAIMIALSVAAFTAYGINGMPAGLGRAAAPDKSEYNLLIIGQDKAASLADVIMLVSLDTQNDRVRVLQIPRDTYFDYTDKDYKKINGALSALGGAEGFAKKLSEAIGIPIDFYVCLDIDAFVEIIDAMGGVEVNVPCDMEYSDPYQDLKIRISKGYQTLNGETAMQFVRFRSGYIRGDISRMDAQKIFLASALKKLRSVKDPITAYRLYRVVSERVDTNMSEGEALLFVSRFMRCAGEDISFVTAPGEDIQSNVSGAWYYILSKSAMEELLSLENFDKNANFVDKNVKSFYDIYNKYCSYKIHRADELLGEKSEPE